MSCQVRARGTDGYPTIILSVSMRNRYMGRHQPARHYEGRTHLAGQCVLLFCWLTHLVVVPGDQPGETRVRGLEVGVALVQLVLHAPAGEVAWGGAQHVRRRGLPVAAVGRDAAFVDVVAEVQHQVEILASHVAIGRVEPVVPGLARGDGQGERAALGWRRASAPDG